MLVSLLVLCLIVVNQVNSYFVPTSRIVISKLSNKSTCLYAKNNDTNKKERKIVKYDNVGDPVYEDELEASQGMNILGFNVDLDPINLTLLIGGVIAFQFFVLANL